MTKKEREKLLREVMLAGELCSNCCYNLGQEAAPPSTSRDKVIMWGAAQRWDKARSAWHQSKHSKL